MKCSDEGDHTGLTHASCDVSHLVVALTFHLCVHRSQAFLASKVMHHTYATHARLEVAVVRELVRDSRLLVEAGKRELDAKRSMVCHVSHEIRYGVNHAV